MDSTIKGWLVLVLLFGTMVYAIAEEITLTTYYPSPRGVYDELRTRGDVAIGKLEPPGARLEIVGGGATSATSALRVRNVDQTPLLEVQNGGNVGIGTGSPAAKVEVAGQIKITGGNPGKDKVLTSDTTGLASWQPGTPSGAVMFFNLSACPTGWTELTSAQGRYVVGRSAGGTLAGTVGTALSNLENRPVGRHTHVVSDPGHSHTLPGNFYVHYVDPLIGPWLFRPDAPTKATTESSTTGVTIANAGSVDGTPAPYIQLLICQKD